MEILDNAFKFLSDNKEVILTVVGVLFGIAKAASNGNAGPIVGKIQKGVDGVAYAAESLGKLLKFISDMLANIVKSDGFGGRK